MLRRLILGLVALGFALAGSVPVFSQEPVAATTASAGMTTPSTNDAAVTPVATVAADGSHPATEIMGASTDQADLSQLDLTTLLAPPPVKGSAEYRAEIRQILAYQKSRTPAMEAEAKADQTKSVFRFTGVFGPKFTQDNLPLTSALFDEVVKVCKKTVKPAKEYFGRPRPYTQDSRIIPCLDLEEDASYPSGHATAGTCMAILLADMVPELKDKIFARGWQYALNRVIGGVHYPSDIQEGRICGTLIAENLLKNPGFKAQYEAARQELRSVLGYPAESATP